MAEIVPFPRLYRCRVPRQEYLELLEASNTVFADLYFGFDSFHSLYVSVNAAGQIVIHGEGTVNDKARGCGRGAPVRFPRRQSASIGLRLRVL